MKKDYEEYRDTGILGGYHPEMAVLREQPTDKMLSLIDAEFSEKGHSA